MAIIYDSTAPADIPHADDGYVFAYNDGLYTQVDAVRARFPDARIITISAVGQASADVVDVEPGCVWPPASAVAYVQRERAAGRNPTVYCGRSNWPAVVQAFYDAGMGQPPYWVAHYTNTPHLCSSSCYPSSVGSLVAVATQYGGDLPGHFDVTVTNGAWPDGLAVAGSGTPLITPASIGGALSQEDDVTKDELLDALRSEGISDNARIAREQTDPSKLNAAVSYVLGTEGVSAGVAALLARSGSASSIDPAAQAKLIADLLGGDLAKAVVDLLSKKLAA